MKTFAQRLSHEEVGELLLVCPNPTMDKQVFVEEMHVGAVLRASRNRTLPGGKPVNVGRAMRAHGTEAFLLVLLPRIERGYRELLLAEGARASFHPMPGQLRDTVVLYEDSGRVTVINGPGATVSPDLWEGFVRRAGELATEHTWVAVTGSFPQGVTNAQVGDLVERLRRSGAKVALDTGPQWLMAGVRARPDLVAPNLAEATQALTGRSGVETVEPSVTTEQDAVEAASALVDRGIEHVVVTVGAVGSAWATSDSEGFVPAVPVPVVNPIGAGDAFLGGVLARLEAGAAFPDAVAWGNATAASAVTQWIPGAAHVDQVHELRARLS